jgi:DNA-binding LacI/PurR family transcriptional regulator
MSNNVELLARRVEADIKRRGLASGDRYLTGDEVGRMLNVSSVTANRAMQLLAEKGLLVRQRKAGTFIGNGVKPPMNGTRKRVHLVLTSGIWPDDHLSATHYVNPFLGGLMEVLPNVSIQTDLVGPQEVRAFTNRMIEEFSRTSEMAGVCLVRSSPDVQRRLAEAGVPTVIFGSVFPGLHGLASIDVDQQQVGRLSFRYLQKAGHSDVLVLMMNQWLAGDNAFVAGVMGERESAGGDLKLNIQSVPPDDEIGMEVVESLLDRPNRPTAVVARSPWIARIVDEVAQGLGLRIPDDLELIVGNHYEVEIDGRTLPRARPKKSLVECGRELGRKLFELNRHQPIEACHEMIPVEFVAE